MLNFSCLTETEFVASLVHVINDDFNFVGALYLIDDDHYFNFLIYLWMGDRNGVEKGARI